MAINQIFQEAINKLNAEKEREVALIKQKVTQEQIVPNNAKVDNACNATIAELQQEQTKKVSAIQLEYAEKKQMVVDTANKEKSEFAETAVNTACATVRLEYDTAIAKLREQIQEKEVK